MSAYALPGLFPPLPRREYAPREPLHHDDKSSKRTTTNLIDSTAERVGISVKEAKLDSALLVHSLAQNETSTATIPRSRRRTRVDNCNGETSISSKEDEAMQFELSITFGGNKYTATRSWPSICKFRKDLIRNVRSIEIPELPSLHPPGVLCRSFSFLQNLLCSYAPTLEGWLRTVTVLVPPDNPILSHFLHESETKDMYCNQGGGMGKLHGEKHILTAIEESETEEDDDSKVEEMVFNKVSDAPPCFQFRPQDTKSF